MKKISLKIGGMSCTVCANVIEKKLKNSKGIESASVNYATSKADINYNDKILNEENITTIIENTGYKVLKDIIEKQPKKIFSKKIIMLLFIVSILLYISMGDMLGLNGIFFINSKNPVIYSLVQFILTSIVVIIGREYFYRGYKNIFKLTPNMDSLVAIGSSASYFYSIYSMIMIFSGNNHYLHSLYFESTAVILTFIMIGKNIEEKTKLKSSNAIEKLMELIPDKAIILDKNGKEVEIRSEEINEGDIIILRPGNRSCIDGIIIEGRGTFNDAIVTGESLPIDKTAGEIVVAGSINLDGYIKLKAENVGENSFINRIIHLVEEAQSVKAPIAKFADKVSSYFVPFVISIAVITAIFWYMKEQNLSIAVEVFVSVLVIACPCALGLATPTAIMAGTGRGSILGILIKNGEILEKTAKVNMIFFDKTGTITQGKPSVEQIKLYNGYTEKEFLNYCIAVEKKSEHPLAASIINYGLNFEYEELDAEDFYSEAGMGVTAIVKNKIVTAGKLEFLIKRGYVINEEFDIEVLQNSGKSLIYVTIDNVLAGVVVISDELRKESEQTIKELEKMGIKSIMLTGDNKHTAETIASKSGIKKVYYGLLPKEKLEIIRKYNNLGNITAMVGDGINDAPALNCASVGIAVAKGSDIAKESADIVLIRDSILDVVTALKLSKKTVKNIKENLLWASIYNIIGIPIAAGILHIFNGPFLNPMIAAGAMSLSSISVVLNAVRLNYYGNIKKEKELKKMEIFKVDKMSCEHCTARVKKIIEGFTGENSVDVSLESKEVKINKSVAADTLSKIKDAINDAGYEVK